MTRAASDIIEAYLSRLESELVAAGAEDTDDLIAEIRSLLTEAAGDDPERADAEAERLGEPSELARGILVERGLDASAGMSSGLWWRLGLAAPIDILVGVALPLAAAVPLYVLARFGQPRSASVATAVALAAATLAWPFFIWRPWRRGGRSLSPGMTLTGLAVVRAPGFWRLVRVEELAEMGLAPRRRRGLAVVAALLAIVIAVAVAAIGLDFGGSWLTTAAISGGDFEDGPPLETQLYSVVDGVYAGLMQASESDSSAASSYATPEAAASLRSLSERIGQKGIRAVRIGEIDRTAPGLYRVDVLEYGQGGAPDSVGASTFIVGRRRWLTPEGVGSDWAIVAIQVGAGPAPD